MKDLPGKDSSVFPNEPVKYLTYMSDHTLETSSETPRYKQSFDRTILNRFMRVVCFKVSGFGDQTFIRVCRNVL